MKKKKQDKVKNMNELAQLLCYGEGKKEQVNIAQMKEILKLLSVQLYVDADILMLLLKNGKRLTKGKK